MREVVGKSLNFVKKGLKVQYPHSFLIDNPGCNGTDILLESINYQGKMMTLTQNITIYVLWIGEKTMKQQQHNCKFLQQCQWWNKRSFTQDCWQTGGCIRALPGVNINTKFNVIFQRKQQQHQCINILNGAILIIEYILI